MKLKIALLFLFLSSGLFFPNYKHSRSYFQKQINLTNNFNRIKQTVLTLNNGMYFYN